MKLRRLSLGILVAAITLIGGAGVQAEPLRTSLKPADIRPLVPMATPAIRYAAPPYSSPGTGCPWRAPNVTDVFTSTGPGTVQYASVSAATTSSPVTIVSAVAGKKILVLYEDIEATGAARTLQWEDNAGSPNTFTGAMNITQNGFLNPTPSPYGLLSTTVAGNALVAAVTGSGCTLNGFIVYTTY